MHRVLMFWAVLVFMTFSVVPLGAQEGGGRRGGPPPAPAGPVPHLADGRPDLQGTFSGSRGDFSNTVLIEEHPGGFGVTAGPSLIIDPPDGKIPYQAWAVQERDRRREDSNGYEDVVGHCEYYDIGRQHSFPMEFLYASNGDVLINQSQHVTRVIDMHRKAHLPAGIRLWNGDSIGHWEGDALVIDTTNFNGRTRLAIGGDFYSADAHVVERFTMLDSNTIKWTMTINDPKVFTRPWTMTSQVPMVRQAQRGAPNAAFDNEDTCHEGNVDLAHLKNAYVQAHGEKERWVK
jgi:hypothetical protein